MNIANLKLHQHPNMQAKEGNTIKQLNTAEIIEITY